MMRFEFRVDPVPEAAPEAQLADGELPVTAMSVVTLTVSASRRFFVSELLAVVDAVNFSGDRPSFLMVRTPAVELPGTMFEMLSDV